MNDDPKSSRTSGYHVFLEPAGESIEPLKMLMVMLATDAGGPIIPAHVTLLSGIEGDEADLVEKTRALAAMSAPVQITLGDIASEEEYFRSLYLLVQEWETMTELHSTAAEVFGMELDRDYVPHLSILYGNYPAELKQQLAADIQIPTGMSFQADQVYLWRTEGEVGGWERVASFPMGNS